jgi:tRNA pseudouridine55 synthase
MDGLLVVDKPVGPTSHDVVARVRRAIGEARVGHTGTLDPAASGVLPLVIGRATRLARFLSADDKSYEALVVFGIATDTYDAQGTPQPSESGPLPTRSEIEQALAGFRGTRLQQPPPYSAKKVGGRRSYRAARAAARLGAKPATIPSSSAFPALALPAPVAVTVHRLDLVGVENDRITLRVDCSAGFYVRALAHELGRQLRVGAHLAALRRTASAGFTIADTVPLALVERDRAAALAAIIPLANMLPGMSAVVLTDEGLTRATRGRDIRPDDVATGSLPTARTPIRLLDRQGQLVGIAEAEGASGFLHPSVVLM